jgi:hypothetical protein
MWMLMPVTFDPFPASFLRHEVMPEALVNDARKGDRRISFLKLDETPQVSGLAKVASLLIDNR